MHCLQKMFKITVKKGGSVSLSTHSSQIYSEDSVGMGICGMNYVHKLIFLCSGPP